MMEIQKTRNLLVAVGMVDFAKKSIEQAKNDFFNLPKGWLSCYQDADKLRGVKFSIFESKKLNEKGSFEVVIKGVEVELLGLGNYSKVDWYIIRKCMGLV